MKATLYKMDEPKASRNGSTSFRRLYFRLETGQWAATDVVPTYRNFTWWEPVIRSGVGTIVRNLFLKHNGKIDADSRVEVLGKEPLQKELLPIGEVH